MLGFRLGLFAMSHLQRFSKPKFTAFSTSSIQLPDEVIFVSSANIRGLVEFKHEGRSLIYNKNKSGPRIEPCGTPHVIFFSFEMKPFNLTFL